MRPRFEVIGLIVVVLTAILITMTVQAILDKYQDRNKYNMYYEYNVYYKWYNIDDSCNIGKYQYIGVDTVAIDTIRVEIDY
jgi:hypothetical protein